MLFIASHACSALHWHSPKTSQTLNFKPFLVNTKVMRIGVLPCVWGSAICDCAVIHMPNVTYRNIRSACTNKTLVEDTLILTARCMHAGIGTCNRIVLLFRAKHCLSGKSANSRNRVWAPGLKPPHLINCISNSIMQVMEQPLKSCDSLTCCTKSCFAT